MLTDALLIPCVDLRALWKYVCFSAFGQKTWFRFEVGLDQKCTFGQLEVGPKVLVQNIRSKKAIGTLGYKNLSESHWTRSHLWHATCSKTSDRDSYMEKLRTRVSAHLWCCPTYIGCHGRNNFVVLKFRLFVIIRVLTN